jgi:[protein-PII] uridylyltransferase
VDVRVTIDNSASAGSSVVEIKAEDDVGLLHRITAALFALDLDVVAARVSTTGHEVVDAFYVRDTSTGGKVTDPAQIDRVRDGVVRAINGSTTRPARPT